MANLISEAAEAARERWVDLGERLTRAAQTLADLRDDAAPVEADRLDAKRLSVLAAYDQWAQIGFSEVESSADTLRGWVGERLVASDTGAERDGLSLVQDYLLVT